MHCIWVICIISFGVYVLYCCRQCISCRSRCIALYIVLCYCTDCPYGDHYAKIARNDANGVKTNYNCDDYVRSFGHYHCQEPSFRAYCCKSCKSETIWDHKTFIFSHQSVLELLSCFSFIHPLLHICVAQLHLLLFLSNCSHETAFIQRQFAVASQSAVSHGITPLEGSKNSTCKLGLRKVFLLSSVIVNLKLISFCWNWAQSFH